MPQDRSDRLTTSAGGARIWIWTPDDPPFERAGPPIRASWFKDSRVAAYPDRRLAGSIGLVQRGIIRCQRLKTGPTLTNPIYRRPGPGVIKRALRVIIDAEEISHAHILQAECTVQRL